VNKRHKAIFVERDNYRRRRLIDLVRLAPVLGAILWVVPLLWPNDGELNVGTADAIVYIFCVWFGLVVMSAVLARGVKGIQEDETSEGH
jgi:hypothetical protein